MRYFRTSASSAHFLVELFHLSIRSRIDCSNEKEMLLTIAGLDAFGFDALSNDKMFRKKSTPSAIADIRKR